MVLLVGVVTACIAEPVEPGDAWLTMDGPWIQGEPGRVGVIWENSDSCTDDDFFCRPSDATTTILAVKCSGCSLLADPAGIRFEEDTSLRVVATTDGPIEIAVSLRYDATGDVRQVTATATGDHETALIAACGLIDTSLEEIEPYHYFYGEVRDCQSKRRPSDTVVIVPQILTYHEHVRFPFCRTAVCAAHERRVAITPAPTSWLFGARAEMSGLAVLPPVGSLATVNLGTTLVTGEPATAEVAIPAIDDTL